MYGRTKYLEKLSECSSLRSEEDEALRISSVYQTLEPEKEERSVAGESARQLGV